MHLPRFSWPWRFVASALIYMVYYYFFGAINYMLTTRPYYETHAGELTVRELEQMAVLVHGPIDFKVRLGFRLTANILLMQRSAARH